jgi:hypothetical protein
MSLSHVLSEKEEKNYAISLPLFKTWRNPYCCSKKSMINSRLDGIVIEILGFS